MQEFRFFPHWLFRPNAPFLEGSLPPHLKDPWARREAWRSHPFFSLKNRMMRTVPGLSFGLSGLGLYILYDQWYHNKGPGAAETQFWKDWTIEREKRLHSEGHDHSHASGTH